jgi:hypothetical protein
MHRFRLSTSVIQFTSPSETAINSDNESDSQPEQRLTTNSEIIRVGNILDQVYFYSKTYKNLFVMMILYLGTFYCY